MPTPDDTDVSRESWRRESWAPAQTQSLQARPEALGPAVTWGYEEADRARRVRTDAWPRRGQLVGRYIALEPLGAGAMGVIWRAYDPELDRMVALKLVRGASGPVARARLVREAQTLAKLSHDNIVSVFDVGTESDEVFVAMEWIDGRDLAVWLEKSSHTWRDVLAVMERAGRGLQAAHDAGIVHRDFKPANVLLADNGRVAVGDFGLARSDDDVDADSRDVDRVGRDVWDEPTGSSIWGSGLTAAGTTVGTPAYMSPEQHHGAPANPRADQYAFAIALYEGLYGTRPFTATDIDVLAREKARGAPAPAPGEVPRRMWPVLARALAVDPAERHGSIAELTAALRHAADSPKRRARAAAAGAGAVLVALALARPWDTAPVACAGVDADADRVWDESVRAEVESTIASTSVVYAASTATHATQAIDRNIDQWRDARRDACEATWVRGEQSPRTLDSRMACLDRMLGKTAATIAVLHEVDARAVERVAELVDALPAARGCDGAQTISETPAPTDPEGIAVLHALDDANARLITADPTIGDALGELEPRVIAHGDDGLHAQLELVRGQWLDQAGRADEANAALRDATRLARAAGLVRTEAEAWIAMVRTSGRTRRFAEGRFYGEVASALVETLADGDDLAADAALQLGVLAFTVGDDEVAAQHYAVALDLFEREHGPTHARVGDVLAKAAGVELRRGSTDRAAAMLERAIEIARGHYGEGHPKLATSLGNLGLVYAAQRRWDVALATMGDAAAMLEAAWGPDHPTVGIAADSTGDVLRRSGRPVAARAAFERALAIYERAFGPEHPALSSALLGLGQSLLDAGLSPEARPPLERALLLAEPGRVSPVQRADILFFLARVLERDDPSRTRALAQEALAVYREELEPQDDRLPEIEAFVMRLAKP